MEVEVPVAVAEAAPVAMAEEIESMPDPMRDALEAADEVRLILSTDDFFAVFSLRWLFRCSCFSTP
jgi:hypothetical protein